MEQIIISRENVYFNKAELIKEINGKIVTKAVDPVSVREIINYVKEGFINLEDVVINNEDFSFAYGKYKVTFSHYKDFEFIVSNLVNTYSSNTKNKTLVLDGNDLSIIINDFNLKVKHYDKYPQINDFLIKVRELKKNAIYQIRGKNLYLNINGFKLILKDYENFKTNPYFGYIFSDIKNKKFKIIKRDILIGILIITGSIGVASLLKKSDKHDDSKVDVNSTETMIDESLSTVFDDISTTSKALLDKPSIQYIDADKEHEIKETQAPVFEDKQEYKNLNIGSCLDDEKFIKTKELYYDLIEKYSIKYGLDPNVVLAIATQERGVHSEEVDDGGAIGLMQIQVSVWNNKSIIVYDYDKNEEITINFSLENISDLEGNINAGCAILQQYMMQMNGNKFATIQSYNNGPSAVNDIISSYSYASGKSKDEILENNDLTWLDYRSNKYDGDKDYLEHVLRYYAGDLRNLECKMEGKSLN